MFLKKLASAFALIGALIASSPLWAAAPDNTMIITLVCSFSTRRRSLVDYIHIVKHGLILHAFRLYKPCIFFNT